MTDQMQDVTRRISWLYFFYVNLLIAGALLIWIAEQMAGGKSLPFSYWYLAFVAYALYALLTGFFLRRKFKRQLAGFDLAKKAFFKRWQALQSIGLFMAYSPIVYFCVARILLKMSIWYSVSWYVVGYIFLILWRPKLPMASKQREDGPPVAREEPV